MKAVWFNTVGEVFEIFEDDVVNSGDFAHNLFAPGDTIKFVDDDDERYQVGGAYSI